MRKYVIFLVVGLFSYGAFCDTIEVGRKESKSYVVNNDGFMFFIGSGKELIIRPGDKTPNGVFLNSSMRVADKERLINISYKCNVWETVETKSKTKYEDFRIYFNPDLYKKVNFVSGRKYFITFRTNKKELTLEGISNASEDSSERELTFTAKDSIEIRKLLKYGGKVELIVRNTIKTVPHITINFDGYKEGYDKIKECIESN